MAQVEKVKSTDQILQALDALSQLNQARATRRSTSLPLPRSKDGAATDVAVEEAQLRPRVWRRLSPRSPLWSNKPNRLDLNEIDVDEEEGDDAALVIVIKSPTTVYRRTLPFRSRSKLDRKEGEANDEEEYDSTNSTNSSTQSAATSEADGEKTTKGAMTSWSPIRAMSPHTGSMRLMGCLFSVEVTAAQGLPPSMNGLRVAVTVRRKETRDSATQTMPARVQLGAAYFDKALYIRCHLYGTTGKPISFEPQPFILSLIAINAPELDFGRSTVDLSLFAKEFTDTSQQGECVRQWDMVFPLDGRAKGGELIVKLELQSIDDAGAALYSPRKLRRSQTSNMLTPKVTRTKTPKMGVTAQGLQGIDSFILDEPKLEPTLVAEMKETQQKESECEASELTPVDKVKEEQQKDLEHRPIHELTRVAKMVEEEQQEEPMTEPADEPTSVTEVVEERQQKELEHQPADEPTPVAEVKEQDQQKESEQQLADESIPVVEMMEQEQQKEPELELVDEPTPLSKIKEEEQHKEPECDSVSEPTLVAEVKEQEQQKESEYHLTDESTPMVEVMEEKQQKEPELEPADEPISLPEVKEEEQHKEPECDPIDVGKVKEEQEKESELEPTDEPTPVIEVEENEQQRQLELEPIDEPTPVVEMKQEERECTLADEPTSVVEVKEEEQQKEPMIEIVDEPSPVVVVKEEKQQKERADEPTPLVDMKEEQQKELECGMDEDPTSVVEVKEEEQHKEAEVEPIDEPTLVAEVKEEEQHKDLELELADLVANVKEEEQQKEQECEGVEEPTLAAVVEEEEHQNEPECEPVDEPTQVAVKVEEQQKEPKCEPEDTQEGDDLELPKFDITDKEVEGQEVKAELKVEVVAKKGSRVEEEALLVASVEVTKAVANGLDEKFLEATMANDLSNTVVDAVKLMNGKAARSEEVTRESLHVLEQGANKGTAAKPSQPRFKWRTVAFLVPLAILNSKTLGARR